MGESSELIDEKKKKLDYISSLKCRELPNMLSMQGLDRGTIGYQAALELPISNPLKFPDHQSLRSFSLHRQELVSKAHGLQNLTEANILHRLNTIGEIYHGDPMSYLKPAVMLYKELSKIISPDITELKDSYSNKDQICQLLEILTATNIWVDFSQEQWRIQLGRILWGPSASRKTSEGVVNYSGDEVENYDSQRYWFLLQILIGCEVVFGLGASSTRMESYSKSLEEKLNGRNLTPAVSWTLLIARIWLQNIYIELPSTFQNHESNPDFTSGKLKYLGRNQAQQISGLLHFAQEIRWPNIKKLGANLLKMSITVATQISSKSKVHSSKANDYGYGSQLSKSNCDKDFNTDYLSGWFSDFYLSGLILPGESLGYLLMSCVLENDVDALSRLGCKTNPYGAFVYSGRSFWSTSTILGKILAAKETSTECMGWVSSDIIPRNFKEGWIDLGFKINRLCKQLKACLMLALILFVGQQNDSKGRIWHKKLITRHSYVIAAADSSSILSGDFVYPTEKLTNYMSVELLALDISHSGKSSLSSSEIMEYLSTSRPDEKRRIGAQNCSTTLHFSVGMTEEKQKVFSINIYHDVYFVTAHPCILTSNSRTPISPTHSLCPSHHKTSSMASEKSSGMSRHSQLLISVLVTNL